MRIAIVGGGIGGLACALALSGHGHEIAVLERRTGFGETGAGIQLSPNATGVLAGLGLSGALARTACSPERIAVRALASGRPIGAVALGAAMRERFGAPFLSIARADLHMALLDGARARPDIRLRVGRSLVALADAPEEVTLLTEKAGGGQESLAADVAVGADGVWSTVRAALGDARRPAHAGFAAMRANVPAAACPPSLAGPEIGLWLGRNRHVVHYPVGGGATVNLVAVLPRADDGPAEISRAEVERGLAEADPLLRELLAAAPSWSAWPLHDLPVRAMSRGRVALLGDAAHPVLPYLAQGGSLAIEDAAELAACLATGNPDPRAALRAYARLRTARARRVQRAARRNGPVYHAGFPLSGARNLVMRRSGADGMAARYDWIYGWRPTRPSADA